MRAELKYVIVGNRHCDSRLCQIVLVDHYSPTVSLALGLRLSDHPFRVRWDPSSCVLECFWLAGQGLTACAGRNPHSVSAIRPQGG